jgi:prepilin-type N-terminal cleavage/methylation domain-containing protein
MRKLSRGFTITEVIVVLGILSILSALDISSFIFFQKKVDLDNVADVLSETLRVAQSNTLASQQNTQYGVYFDISASPNQYTLFKGATYATRDATFSKVYTLPGTLEISGINLADNQIVFQKLSGWSQQGDVTLRLKSNPEQAKTLYISNSGTVSYAAFPTTSDSSRLKDTRHVIFTYTRQITPACPIGETVNLYFDGSGSPQQAIPICDNLSNGEFSWQGTVNAGGQGQAIRIHTIGLSGSNPQFSIFRDRRINTKSLRIRISGDSTGDLASYAADGLTATSSSIYVSEFLLK